ncbi:GNAT family N-acetyltransferase [Nocardioides gilvus]|uniref:GNAT family N-acetyltransferase n=1 Tax=Nocardioides gilvus TaxID=1735589 RepID=UPI000D74C55D|nr:GNAT family N-acetyltransferase [Nocardioides gilvus]
MSTEANEATTVSDNPQESRYELFVAGELAGFAEYTLDGSTIDFTHTEVFEKFGGRGLAKVIATESLDEARERDLAVLPHCALYQRFIAKNEEYVDLVPQDQRHKFDLGGA